MNKKNKVIRPFVFAISFWFLAFIFALKWGAVGRLNIDLITAVRLPRVLLASAIGMGLAVAGACMQVLFSNSLCEPYTLGVSSGSALGAVIGMSLGIDWMVSGMVGTAFFGALVFAGILYLISMRPGIGNISLLLSGVMLGFLGSSLVTVWITLSDPNGLQGAIVWLFGDLSRARLKGALLVLGANLILTFCIWSNWRELDGLLVGEEGARALGVDVSNMRRKLLILTSLVIGLCVSSGGMIGFVGLVVPHFARRLVGSMHARLIPLCMILGAAVLTASDCISRVITRPFELPVGVVTSLLGAPLFLWIILKKQKLTS